jgi:hypothetical protein
MHVETLEVEQPQNNSPVELSFTSEEVIKINQALMYAVQSLINLANCDYGANKLRDKAAYSVMQIHEILGIKESV